MNQKDIRWRQRFENFEKSYRLLEQSVEIEMKIRNAFFPAISRLYECMKTKT